MPASPARSFETLASVSVLVRESTEAEGLVRLCPPKATSRYCLVTCETGNFDGQCDFMEAENHRIIDCSTGKPVIESCGRSVGCATASDGATCT